MEEWENGRGVVQIVTPKVADENQLQFCYYKDSKSVNRPLTMSPSQDVAEWTDEIVETMAGLARSSIPTRSRSSLRNQVEEQQ